VKSLIRQSLERDQRDAIIYRPINYLDAIKGSFAKLAYIFVKC
jgi:hypothetical protein